MSLDNKGNEYTTVMKGYNHGVLMDISKVINFLNHDLLLVKV